MVRPFGKLRAHHQRILLDFAIVLGLRGVNSSFRTEARFCSTIRVILRGDTPGDAPGVNTGANPGDNPGGTGACGGARQVEWRQVDAKNYNECRYCIGIYRRMYE